jgi:type II secretory pathway component PulF
MSNLSPHYRLLTRAIWTMVAFLLGFVVLLVFVSRHYLMPALEAYSNADPDGRRQLAAVSALMLAILLITIIIGLLLTFRVRRFFKVETRARAEPTKYMDAWKEAGKRVE